MDKKKPKIRAVSHDTKGGKHAMSEMNPQQEDSMKPKFNGIRIHDEDKNTWDGQGD